MLQIMNLYLVPILLGISFGFVVQRGFFCLNSGTAEFLTRKDSSKFYAFLLAISIQAIIFAALFVLIPNWIPKVDFFPIPALLGGILFGFSMYYAGGCATGIWFKIGEGKVGALLAITGLTVGLIITPLFVESSVFEFFKVGRMHWNSLYNLSIIAGFISAVLSLILLTFLFRAPNTCPKSSKVGWKTTGSAIAIIGILSWISSHYAGRPYGMGVIGGTADLFTSIYAFRFPRVPWEMLFVLGIPLGSFVSAKKDGKFGFQKIPIGKSHRNIFGGLGMGIGASIAGGCTVGHGLVGIPVLSLAGMLTFLAIILGVWLRISFQELLPKKS